MTNVTSAGRRERRLCRNALRRLLYQAECSIEQWFDIPAVLATMGSAVLLVLPRFGMLRVPPALAFRVAGLIPDVGWAILLGIGAAASVAGRVLLRPKIQAAAAMYTGAAWMCLWIMILLSGRLALSWSLIPLLSWVYLALYVRFHARFIDLS